MKNNLCLRVRSGVNIQAEGDDLLLARKEGRGMRIRQPDTGQRLLMEYLTAQGGTSDQLLEQVLANSPTSDTSMLYYLLYSLEGKGFLSYALMRDNTQNLVTLEPMSSRFRYQNTVQDKDSTVQFRLSRFAWLRREGEAMLLESSVGYARLLIHDSRIASLMSYLSQPCALHALYTFYPDFSATEIKALIELLFVMQAVAVCDKEGMISEDHDPIMRHWDYHDLLFHSRSRSGRHDNPCGMTYRFVNSLPHEPVIKQPSGAARIELPKPEALPTVDFFEVVEQRRSVREVGNKPINTTQLTSFLWHVARVKGHYHLPNSHDPSQYEASLRPCASPGAMHELELYLTVSRCEGIASGMYRYAPEAHALEFVAELGASQKALLVDACRSTGMTQTPDILITLAARFGRMAWKYQGMAYAATLKHVGVMYQQMYLVATALSLAPCGIGCGDSDLLADCIGSNYYAESAVGEFMLSGRDRA